MDTSIDDGSAAAYEFVCKPCDRDNNHEEGVGYCVDCVEFLCSKCFASHKDQDVSREHTLQDQASMPPRTLPPKRPTRPKARLSSVSNPYDPFSQNCSKHEGQKYKLYCNEHDALACPICLSRDHKECKDVSYIPDVSGDTAQSKEFNRVFAELKNLQALLRFEHHRFIYNEIRIEELNHWALASISQFRDDILQVIDNLYAAVEQELDAIRDQQIADLTRWMRKYNAVAPDIEKKIRNLETNMDTTNFNQLYIDMKLAKADLYTFQDKVQRLAKDNYVSQYRFEGNADIVQMLRTVKSFGTVLKKKTDSEVSAKLLHGVSVKSEEDVEDCNINAALVLPDGDLALSDHHNIAVKVIAPSQNRVRAQLVLESEPFDIAAVEDDQLAVALPKVGQIQILQLSDTDLTIIKVFETSRACIGVECKDKTLIIICQFPGCVLIMDMDGTILRVLDTDVSGKHLFSQPRCLALSVDKSVIYTTEWEDGRVLAVSLVGEELAEFQYPGLKKPLGVASDIDGAVYISYGDNHGIYRLSPTCAEPQKLLGDKDGLKYPWAIAIDRPRALLYVGSVSELPQFRNKISVFQLKYEWT